MARIASSKSKLLRNKQKGLLLPIRLCIIFSIVGIIFIIAFLLYQTDQAMFRHKMNIGNKNNNAATTTIMGRMQKNALLSQQQQQQQQLRLKNSNIDQEEANDQQQDANRESTTTRKVEFDLADLKDGNTGTIIIETYDTWAPIGVARFWELIVSDFYIQCKMFRVIPNFIAQFGIASLPSEHTKWQHNPIIDDHTKDIQSNTKYTVTFAMAGKDTRTTQLFINMKDNSYLDSQGFTPIGRIVSGMEYINEINDQYKELPNQNKIIQEGNVYLDQHFPGLTYISAIRIITGDDDGGSSNDDKEEEEEEKGDDKKENEGDDKGDGDDEGGEKGEEEGKEGDDKGDDEGEEEEEEKGDDGKEGDDKET